MNRTKRGDLAEMVAATEAMSMGFDVSFPYSSDCRYDLVLDGGDLLRIQVKRVYTVKRDVGGDEKCVDARRMNRKTPKKTYAKDSYDFLFACEVDTRTIWILPFEVANAHKGQIKLNSKSKREYRNNWDILKYVDSKKTKRTRK